VSLCIFNKNNKIRGTGTWKNVERDQNRNITDITDLTDGGGTIGVGALPAVP
jgi:hypothetical protein